MNENDVNDIPDDGVDASRTDQEKQGAARAARFQALLSELDSDSPSQAGAGMEAILDVPVTISMEIGRRQITIRDLLQLNRGAVVELDRLEGEPMDVLVNGSLIARGELVVVNDKFGIRLTDIVKPGDRVKRLR